MLHDISKMLFNSFHFLLFGPAAIAGYYLCPGRYRWLFLVLASCYFYAAFIPKYLLVLFLLILLDYLAAIAIEDQPQDRSKFLLGISLTANLLVLSLFKYFNFVSENLTALLHSLHLGWAAPTLHWALPIGLSFHTFQSMSYTIEVYRGKYKAERHLGIYTLYVLFWPQLVAGPIERPQNLLPQLQAPIPFDLNNFSSGFELVLRGYLKKSVMADRLGLWADPVFKSPELFSGASMIVAMFAFTLQIYFDFSGYSDIAIGVARMMGIDLMKNFDAPYASCSISEFWRRWHISLMSWFRDYVFNPLGGFSTSTAALVQAILITFVLSGLWHGANWTYICWGLLNAVYLIGEASINKLWRNRPPLPRILAWSITFTLISVSWVFFRASSISTAYFMLGKMGSIIHAHTLSDLRAFFALGMTELAKLSEEIPARSLAALGLGMTLLLTSWRFHIGEHRDLMTPWRAAFNTCVVWLVIMVGVYDMNRFIYFQF